MVAAGFGLPATVSSAASVSSTKTTSSNHDVAARVNFTQLALQENNRRPAFTVDYWHQHAIRTVIRHLSFAMAPQTMPLAEASSSLEIHHLALLDTLSTLLMRESPPPAIVRTVACCVNADDNSGFSVRAWISQVQGIRAGPQRLS